MDRGGDFHRFDKIQNVKCYNCGNQGHLKRDCRNGVPRNNATSKNNQLRIPLLSGLCRRCSKNGHWANECKSMKNIQGILCCQ